MLRTEANDLPWVRLLLLGDIVVEKTCQFQAMPGCLVVTEHHGNRGNNLNIHAKSGVFGNAYINVETIGPDFAEKFTMPVDDVALTIAFQAGNTGNTMFPVQIRPLAGQDVGMHIDFEHKASFSCSGLIPG